MDAEARAAFAYEIDTNFSLIAPAGVGKTYSIVQRILEITRRDAADTALSRLVVVTYTRRAATEMQDRVYAELLELGASAHIFEAMDRAFFGTIHAFCARLLRLYGVYIGIPSVLEPAPDPVQLWKEFLFSSEGEVAVEAGVNALGSAVRYFSIQELLAGPPPDGREGESLHESVGGDFVFSPADFAELLSENQILEARSQDSVREGQRIASQWLEKFRSDISFLPLPNFSKGGKKFLMAWEAAFSPLRQWIQAKAKYAFHVISLKYQQWRLKQGRLSYSDQIAFTVQLLKHPRVGTILRQQKLSVILDEAQDTDPLQFEVLFEISGGRISMVGDPQQSIYGTRADLRVYQQFHRRLCHAPQGRELQYQKTFRCRSAILDFVNQVGPGLLNGEMGQVQFVPLTSACERDIGQILRLPIVCNSDKIPPLQTTKLVANEVARWLREIGLEALRVRDWSQVAVLCPRKRWLETLAISLRKEGFSVQIHSERGFLGDSPVYAWWTSLFWVLTHPTDSFEIAGLLREVFAVQDSDLASLCRGDPSRLYLDAAASVSFLPSLQLLGELVEEVKNLPLRSAVDIALCKTGLLQRLLSLPKEESMSISSRHRELLVQASEAEGSGLTLEEFAQALRNNFQCTAEAQEVQSGAIQLMTCQKAKGLEWDAVIIPYFHRKISFRLADSMLKGGAVSMTARLQELQRLLYVSLTRARNTLVLVDDSNFFPSGDKSKTTVSFAQLLGKEGLRAFKDLPQKATAVAATTARSYPSLFQPKNELTSEEVADSWLETARRLAFRFPHKLTPHSLVKSSSLEETPEIQTSGLDYGIWWHECAEFLPLNQLHWMDHLEETLKKCPDPQRGRQEWKLFSQSILAKRLIERKCLLYREMPFCFLEGQVVIEGIIDLGAFDSNENNWLLIDWKTDRQVTACDLLARYKDQLGTYARCLHGLTGRKIEAGLYAVSLGEWIPLKAR